MPVHTRAASRAYDGTDGTTRGPGVRTEWVFARPLSTDPAIVCAVCSVLTQLCLDDISAVQIREANGVYLVGILLLKDKWLTSAAVA